MNPEVFEHNLRLLIRRSWVPVKPAPDFVDRLAASCEQRMSQATSSNGAGQPLVQQPSASGWLRHWRWIGASIAAAALLFALARPLWQPSHSDLHSSPETLGAGKLALRTPPLSGPWRSVSSGTHIVAGELTEAMLPVDSTLRVTWDALGAQARIAPDSVAQFSREDGLSLGQGSAEITTQGTALPLATAHTRLTAKGGKVRLEVDQQGRDELLLVTVISGTVQLSGDRFIHPRNRPYHLWNGTLDEPPEEDVGRVVIPQPKAPSLDEQVHEEDGAQSSTLMVLVHGPNGVPIQSVRIWTRPQVILPHVADAVHHQVQSSTGVYRLDQTPGDYTVAVEAPTFAPFLIRNLTLRPGASHPLQVTLEPGRPIAGYAVDASTGTPLQDVMVVIEDSLAHQVLHAQGLEFGPAPYASALSDGSGYWRIHNAPLGRHTLRATSLGFAPIRMEIAVVEASDTKASPQDIPHFEFTPGGSIEGLVQRSDGTPWPSTSVIASRNQIEQETSR